MSEENNELLAFVRKIVGEDGALSKWWEVPGSLLDEATRLLSKYDESKTSNVVAKMKVVTAKEIRALVNAPHGAVVTIAIPGGGDWSNTSLDISESPDEEQVIKVIW